MKKLIFLLFVFIYYPLCHYTQSVKNVNKVPNQEIEILSGNPKDYKNVKIYYVKFEYTDLGIGGYDDEKAYIEYMREDAELRRKSSDEWENKWYSDRKYIFQPKFLELFEKYAGKKLKINPTNDELQYELNMHTTFIEIGFNRNFKKSPTYINTVVTISDKNNAVKPFVVSLKYLIGNEVMSSYSEDFRRIEEAYAKCGKELAKYLSRVIY